MCHALSCHVSLPFHLASRCFNPKIAFRCTTLRVVSPSKETKSWLRPQPFPTEYPGRGSEALQFPESILPEHRTVGRAVNRLPATTTTLPVRSGNPRRCSGNPNRLRIERVHIRSIGTGIRSLGTAGDSPWRKTGLAWIRGLQRAIPPQTRKAQTTKKNLIEFIATTNARK